MTVPILAGDSITLSLGGRAILQSAYVDAVSGAITVLVGRSGCGKTTFFKVLVGERKAEGGHVRWHGVRLSRPRLATLARDGLFYHPDRAWLARHLTFNEHLSMSRDANWETAVDAFGAGRWLARKVGTLSEGELRLTELAFGFALQPDVAILDEPFRGLEPLHREHVARGLRDLADRGTAILYADHDVESVRQTADRLFSMEGGATRVVEGFKARPLHEWYHAWPR